MKLSLFVTLICLFGTLAQAQGTLAQRVLNAGSPEELNRILATQGSLLIIDKNSSELGRLELPDWEQWFDVNKLALKLEKIGFETTSYANVPYENRNDGLFFGLIGKKNG